MKQINSLVNPEHPDPEHPDPEKIKVDLKLEKLINSRSTFSTGSTGKIFCLRDVILFLIGFTSALLIMKN